MGFLDKAKGAAKKAVHEHGDKVSEATRKAANFADKQTEGKHADKIAKAEGKVNETLDRHGKNDGPR